MGIKWSILIPAVVLISLSGYYVATQPEEATISATLIAPVEVSAEEIPVDEPTPEIEIEDAPILQVEVVEPLPEEEEVPIQEEPLLEEEEPLEEEEVLDEEELPQEEEEEEAPTDEAEEPLEEEPPVTTTVHQSLSADIYDLAGSYMSDQGVAVEIAFADGYYTISLQGMSDRHSSITELSPPSGNTLDLQIALTSMPIVISLSRSEDGTLTIAAYMSGGAAPILSATATRVA